MDQSTGQAFVLNADAMRVPVADLWAWVPRWLWRLLPGQHPRTTTFRLMPGSVSIVKTT